jgi:hypothetical protein
MRGTWFSQTVVRADQQVQTDHLVPQDCPERQDKKGHLALLARLGHRVSKVSGDIRGRQGLPDREEIPARRGFPVSAVLSVRRVNLG